MLPFQVVNDCRDRLAIRAFQSGEKLYDAVTAVRPTITTLNTMAVNQETTGGSVLAAR